MMSLYDVNKLNFLSKVLRRGYLLFETLRQKDKSGHFIYLFTIALIKRDIERKREWKRNRERKGKEKEREMRGERKKGTDEEGERKRKKERKIGEKEREIKG